VDPTSPSAGEKVVLGAGTLLVLDLFLLPWYHINIGGVFPIDRTALEPPVGWLAILAWLATLALLAQILIPRLSHQGLPQLSIPWSRIAVAEGGAVFGLLLVKFLVTGYLGFGAWLGLVLAGAVAYGAWAANHEPAPERNAP
jgi:hypothetical protein